MSVLSRKNKQTSINFINKHNLIVNIYLGDQNAAAVKETGAEVVKLAEVLEKKARPVRILTDLSSLGKVSLAARHAGVEVVRSIEFERLAIFGNFGVSSSLVQIISYASGKADKIKFFSSINEAKVWLLNS